jgi:hypothetical protein
VGNRELVCKGFFTWVIDFASSTLDECLESKSSAPGADADKVVV